MLSVVCIPCRCCFTFKAIAPVLRGGDSNEWGLLGRSHSISGLS